MIYLRNVDKYYAVANAPARRVLSEVSMSVAPGACVAIIGPSGAGKSSLLRVLAGLESFERGEIGYFGHVIRGGEKASPRRELGFCFQDFQLFPHLTVLENVSLAMRVTRARALNVHDIEQHAFACLRRVGCELIVDRYPGALSGGQKQRVALARALALEPKAVLLDEPVSALDPECVQDVVDECLALKRNGQSLVVTSHHLPFAKAIADSVVFMVHGEIVEIGTPAQIFQAPQTDRLRQYLAHCLAM